ncbi:4Fe-4S dicluster domain-containing protein [Desulfovibrio oxamicus]|uniref:4Fe-4S dicluster domain-containing protein n=1 Tax=Nitratidesulfovibrio oxamicus TaxID=32016 RepID=A0ABS0J5D7_9BACT|nr:4Fe-4S binding protein [Nitratidesulfovibrio oxamicus]MBG3877609.1 4Fe-4S dicluster domain-containing protein [Nitratidesulfovibrio oxamicus]
MASIFRTLADLWSLVVGLGITGKQFCKPGVTVHYPRAEVTPEAAASFRGPIELIGLDKDPAKPKCIACMLCVSACPSNCIAVTRAPTPKPTPEELKAMAEAEARGEKPKKPAPPKAPGTWTYDFSLCSLCGSCVEVCPVDSIGFSRDIYMVGTKREDFVFDQLARLARKAAARKAVPKAEAKAAPEAAPPPAPASSESGAPGTATPASEA